MPSKGAKTRQRKGTVIPSNLINTLQKREVFVAVASPPTRVSRPRPLPGEVTTVLAPLPPPPRSTTAAADCCWPLNQKILSSPVLDDDDDNLATNVCIRGGFERFVSPPGTSDDECSPSDFWTKGLIEDEKLGPIHGLQSPERKHHQMTICSGCHTEINDRFIMKVHPDLQFHADCLKTNPKNGKEFGALLCCLWAAYFRLISHSLSLLPDSRPQGGYWRGSRWGLGASSEEKERLNTNKHGPAFPYTDPPPHTCPTICLLDRWFPRIFWLLVCFECARTLDEHCTAFVRDGRTYCKDDHFRLFGTKCQGCSREFTKAEMVMRAGRFIYHVECFCCTVQKNNRVYCRNDCETGNIPESSNLPSNSQLYDEDSWETSTLTSLDHTSPPLSVRSPKSEDMTTPQNGYQNSSGSSSGGSSKKKKDKQTTRVRTVLNETQLKILKQCYSMNSRPDALLKEQLVEMTGLNARVIRVWFQNKRCKDKKRQIQIHESRLNAEKERALNGVRMNGIGPLIAAAPTTHVDTMNHSGPIEIAHYPQWPQPTHEGPGFGGGPPPLLAYPELTDLTDLTDLSYGMPGPSMISGAPSTSHGGPSSGPVFADFSPRLETPDLSSPSCSE
ncbi:unnamed protein product [Caenorhabditis auriculariae]|uniref:Homeobox domain-containing protein n=1 Tax=Caenorhabditis auriculariae TaxID=2777116 RepID=A0A8S1HWW3_9PELO|nr:unnamed protein product [Caenorhabditis auriculariae]